MKNRIICAPTSPSMIDLNGHFTPEMIAYLEEKAMGGAGVVTYGEAIVHSATGKSHFNISFSISSSFIFF
ncbi:hypothetical protein [Extibacter muris]|uniref:hypothetical protein n=1 Tax=Extibacter muris TaxID=1796622 RepID=UPI0021CA8766|nr:hypothetical protein [Extibacter muris]MCU0080729.1 hypothetical protein [Extibacter muris]